MYDVNKKPEVQIPVLFQKLKNYEDQENDTRFLKAKIWLMHLEENLNSSYFSKSVVEAAIPTLANTPVLGFIKDNYNGEKDFAGHEMILIQENGEYKIKYIGKAIGVIPESNNAQFEMRLCDDGIEREFLTVECLIWTKWDDPIDIFNRDKVKSESMELHDDFTGEFRDDGLFHFTEFKFFGACVLSDDNMPAMQNASIEVQFSYDNLHKEIQQKIEQFKKFEQQQQSITGVDIDYNEGGNNVDEKLKILELFTLTEDQINTIKESIKDYSVSELVSKLQEFEGEKRKSKIVYELSHDDVRGKILDRLNPYNEEEDRREWNYWILEVFDGYCIIEDESESEKYYKVPYAVNEETEEVILGVMQEIVMMWLTPEEAQEVENMRGDFEKLQKDFAALKEETTNLREFKQEKTNAERKEAELKIFEQYEDKLKDNAEFKAIKEKSTDYTLEALEKELAFIYVKYNAKFTTKNKTDKDPVKINIDNEPETKIGGKPYDYLFEKYATK